MTPKAILKEFFVNSFLAVSIQPPSARFPCIQKCVVRMHYHPRADLQHFVIDVSGLFEWIVCHLQWLPAAVLLSLPGMSAPLALHHALVLLSLVMARHEDLRELGFKLVLLSSVAATRP